jgi:uncharacterized protein YcfL
MKIIVFITILLILVGCSAESENVNNTNQPNGTIIADERGPQLKKLERQLYKELKEKE